MHDNFQELDAVKMIGMLQVLRALVEDQSQRKKEDDCVRQVAISKGAISKGAISKGHD